MQRAKQSIKVAENEPSGRGPYAAECTLPHVRSLKATAKPLQRSPQYVGAISQAAAKVKKTSESVAGCSWDLHRRCGMRGRLGLNTRRNKTKGNSQNVQDLDPGSEHTKQRSSLHSKTSTGKANSDLSAGFKESGLATGALYERWTEWYRAPDAALATGREGLGGYEGVTWLGDVIHQ